MTFNDRSKKDTWLYARDIQERMNIGRNKAISTIKALGGEKDCNGKWRLLELNFTKWYTCPLPKYSAKGDWGMNVRIDKVVDRIRKYFEDEHVSMALVKRNDRPNYIIRLYGSAVSKPDTLLSLRTKDKKEAEAIYDEIKGRLRMISDDGIIPRKTEAFFDEWLLLMEKGNAESTYKRHRAVIDKVIMHLPSEVHLIKSQHMEMYKDSLTVNNYHPVSIRTEFNILNTIFRKAIKLGYTKTNPVVGIQMPKKPEMVIHTYSQEELDSIFKELERRKGEGLRDQCPQAWEVYEAIVHCLNNTGARISDVLNLQWENVDLENSIITIPSQKKTGKRATVRIPSDYKQRLEKWAEGKQLKGHVFLNTNGKPVQYSHMDNAIRRVLKGCGFKKKSPMHSFRHTVAMRLLAANVPIDVVANQLGDTIDTIVRYYVHPTMPTLDAIDKAFEGVNGNGTKADNTHLKVKKSEMTRKCPGAGEEKEAKQGAAAKGKNDYKSKKPNNKSRSCDLARTRKDGF